MSRIFKDLYLNCRKAPGSSEDKYTSVYTVHGATVGHTTLKAVAHLPDGRQVSSTVRPVEVFPPLELIPRNITLIIGALFQVRADLHRSPLMPWIILFTC